MTSLTLKELVSFTLLSEEMKRVSSVKGTLWAGVVCHLFLKFAHVLSCGFCRMFLSLHGWQFHFRITPNQMTMAFKIFGCSVGFTTLFTLHWPLNLDLFVSIL